MRNMYKSITVGGLRLNILELPNTGVFKLSVTAGIGAGIEEAVSEALGKDMYGTSHLVEHLSFKSPMGYDSDELLAMFKKYGNRNANTGLEDLKFFYTTISEHYKFAIDSVMKVTFNDLKLVTEEEFISERDVVINEINRYYDNKQLILSMGLRSVFINSVPKNNLLGTEEILRNVTLDDVIKIKNVYNVHEDKHFNIVYDPNELNIDEVIDDVLTAYKELLPSLRVDDSVIDVGIYKESVELSCLKTNTIGVKTDQTVVAILIPTVDDGNFTSRLGRSFTSSLSDEHSMFNIIRDKHGLTYGVSYSAININTVEYTMFKVDVDKKNVELVIKLFKEIVINMPDVYTVDKHESIISTSVIEDTLDSLNLRDLEYLFSKSRFGDIPNDIAIDASKHYKNTINDVTHEDVKQYLENVKEKVINEDFIIVTNENVD